MTELELVRREVEALPRADERARGSARDALRQELCPPTRPRLDIRPARLVVAVAFLAVAYLVVVVAHRHPADPVAAAANALAPTDGSIVHTVSRTSIVFRSAATTTRAVSDDESWFVDGGSARLLDRTTSNGRTWLTDETSCGTILYDPRGNTYTVFPVGGGPPRDPAAAARAALRNGYVRSRKRLVFHGIPAWRIVLGRTHPTITLVIRRDDGHPLETVERVVTASGSRTERTTYSLVEHLPRSPAALARTRLPKHADAFYLRMPGRACAHFGDIHSLTGRSTTP